MASRDPHPERQPVLSLAQDRRLEQIGRFAADIAKDESPAATEEFSPEGEVIS